MRLSQYFLGIECDIDLGAGRRVRALLPAYELEECFGSREAPESWLQTAIDLSGPIHAATRAEFAREGKAMVVLTGAMVQAQLPLHPRLAPVLTLRRAA